MTAQIIPFRPRPVPDETTVQLALSLIAAQQFGATIPTEQLEHAEQITGDAS